MSTGNDQHSNLVQITPRRPAPLSDEYWQRVEDLAKAPTGKKYWRSLEELADTKDFQQFVQNEFPSQLEQFSDPVGRRRFLKLMGASLALAGASACAWQPREQLVPYIEQPEEIVPGKSLFFATAMTMAGVATGLLARSREGRPVKLEGNPQHPASLGATDIYAQASILTLYDPDRSRTILERGEIRSWANFRVALRAALDEQRIRRGTGFRILTETVVSPTLADQLRKILAELPEAKWHQYEPVGRDGAGAGARLAFGQSVNTIYRFDQAARVLSIDSDFLACGPGDIRYAREFIARRRVEDVKQDMNRLYAVESTPSNTGALADHRLALRPSEIEPFARTVAAALGASAGAAGAGGPTYTGHAEWVAAMVRDLQQFRGRSIIIAGSEQSPTIHALIHAMNAALGNVGTTVIYTDPVEANPVDQMQSIRELTDEMEAGRVELLMIIGGNPVYNAPADLNFRERLDKVKLRAHLSLYNDETSELCQWHIPEAHYLEAWSDTRAYDGTATIVQPLVEPLYEGRSAHELLAIFLSQPAGAGTGYDIVRNFWQSQNRGGDFEGFWRRALHDGMVPNTALQPKTVAIQGPGASTGSTPQTSGSGLDIVFRTDPSVYDGRFANNGWLQELPKPLTKLTWDNAVIISPATARRYGIGYEIQWRGGNADSDVVELTYQGRTVRGPVWVLPGHPDDTVTVHLGYGRTRAGRVADGQGFDAYKLRTSNAPWFGTGAEMRKTGETYPLAVTQLHHNMEGRDIARSGTLLEYLRDPNAPSAGENPAHAAREHSEGHHGDEPHPSFYPEWKYEKEWYAWGMAIDVNACVGCNACVVACQSENNIPVVGKEQVMRGREMHWLRVDGYYTGEENNPEGPLFMPIVCMHCELAPCEPVCPVVAAVHDDEGLNLQVYNRCIGVRYCSNNCPYKVRKFNFFLYQDWDTPQYKLMRNPEVSVRSRGVMEKCTYCVQRIQWGKIEAGKENRRIRDGEVVTACQAVCPTEAIVFGDINDPESRVTKLKELERNYSLLGELGTRPRTTYLSAMRNPNPEIKAETHGTEERTRHE